MNIDQPLVLAFHLPQFHPIPENDAWWGRGFTEWTNVSKTRPQFRGHYQPHLPADLGFYDLRLPESRELQATMAEQAGISAFAYYHYWFNGHRLLERPVDEIIRTKRPDFPFMYVWANENWTRHWDGGKGGILIEQHYSIEDDLAHIRSLRCALTDERYLCREGKPVIAIYRSSRLPDSRATTEVWREEVERWGLPGLYLLRIESFPDERGDPRPLGFDASIQFQPNWWKIPQSRTRSLVWQAKRYFPNRFSHQICDYREVVELALSGLPPDYPSWPTVMPGFDNSARRVRDARILKNSSPELYRGWLESALTGSNLVAARFENGLSGMVFVNAWNEWAEGNHLEPDQKFGDAFLKATKAAIGNVSELATIAGPK